HTARVAAAHRAQARETGFRRPRLRPRVARRARLYSRLREEQAPPRAYDEPRIAQSVLTADHARMNRRAVIAAAVASATAIALPAAGTSKNAAAEFQLVFDGKHAPSLLHEGPFTTSAAFCRSGYAVDTGVDPATES